MPTASTTRLLEKLESTRELPTIPAVLVPLLRCMEKPWDTVDMHQVVELISQDKSLAARSQQVANSPLFGCSHNVENIQSAVLALGLERIQQIAVCPRPVIMVSCLTQHGAELTLDALEAGAFDYLPKAVSGNPLELQRIKQELIEKIEAAAHSPLAIPPGPLVLPPFSLATGIIEDRAVTPEIIALGTSTGGPKALQDILPELPADLPLPIIVVQHMPPGFTAPFAKRLNSLSKVRVREAEHGETLRPGVVYVAPAGKHTTVFRKPGSTGVICLSDYPSDTQHKPSVDVTMLSVAEVFGRHSIGIILTGMGTDGMEGMTAIRNAGGVTIGQDEATCAVYGMPKCCAESGILQKIVPISQVPWHILRAVRYRAPA